MLRIACEFIIGIMLFRPVNHTALRKAKIVCNFGLFECSRFNITLLGDAVHQFHLCFSPLHSKFFRKEFSLLRAIFFFMR